MTKEILTEVIKKLVGDIQPYGATHIDDKRFENLKTMCEVVNNLVIEIDRAAYENKDRQELSMKQMADYASNFMTKTLGIVEEGQSNPKVKQLEWRPIHSRSIVTSTPIGEYEIFKVLHYDDSYFVYLDEVLITSFSSLDEAKEYVQSEFESKVKKCLISK